MASKFKPLKSVQDQLSLKNNIVVISGGGGFLGLYFAEAVAEFGAIPLLVDINQAAINKNLNSLKKDNYVAYGYACDISNSTNIDEIVSKISNKFKNLLIRCLFYVTMKMYF